MIKACIFDLDGTLANTLDSMAYVANEILRDMGLKEQPTENFKYYSGEGADMLVRRCLRDAGDPGLTRFEECRDRKSTRLNSSHKHRSRMPSSA